MTKEKKNYNGWTNYETWCVNLWISNDQGQADYFQAVARSIIEKYKEDRAYTLSKTLQAYFDNENPLSNASVWTDLLGKALSNVCWYEIAKGMIDSEVKEARK